MRPRSEIRKPGGMPGRKRCTSAPCPYRSGIPRGRATFRRYSRAMGEPLARCVTASGADSARVDPELADQLAGPGLKIAFEFTLSLLDPDVLVDGLRALDAPVVGCTAIGVIGPERGA